MSVPLNPLDAEIIRIFAETHSLTIDEATRVFLEIAVNEYLADLIFKRKLCVHAAVVKINRVSKEPYPESRSRW